MNLVNRIKLYVLLTRLRTLLWLFALMLITLTITLGGNYISSAIPALSQILQDPVTTTLIGAVIGGGIAFYGSVYVQQEQIKSLARIRQRDEIFIPLYDELLALRNSLQKTPCPEDFAIDNHGNQYWPLFAQWHTFNADSRNLRVPRSLAHCLTQFDGTIQEYVRARRMAIEDQEVVQIINTIIMTDVGKQNMHRVDLKYRYLPCNSNLSSMIDKLEIDSSVPGEDGRTLVRILSDQELQNIAEKIHKQCSALESVIRLQKARQDLSEKLDEMIKALEILVRFINEHFEQHDRWF